MQRRQRILSHFGFRLRSLNDLHQRLRCSDGFCVSPRVVDDSSIIDNGMLKRGNVCGERSTSVPQHFNWDERTLWTYSDNPCIILLAMAIPATAVPCSSQIEFPSGPTILPGLGRVFVIRESIVGCHHLVAEIWMVNVNATIDDGHPYVRIFPKSLPIMLAYLECRDTTVHCSLGL